MILLVMSYIWNWLILLFLPILSVGTEAMLLTSDDQERLVSLFTAAYPFQSLKIAYYSVSGLQALNTNFGTKENKICDFINKQVIPKELESLFYSIAVSKILKSCKLKIDNEKLIESLNTFITTPKNIFELHYAAISLHKLNQKISQKLDKRVEPLVTEESSVLERSIVLYLATYFDKDVGIAYLEGVADLLGRSDSTEATRLFPEGLETTSQFIYGVYSLASNLDIEPQIDQEAIVKLSRGILQYKYTESLIEAYHVVIAIRSMSKNEFLCPVAVRISNPSIPISQNFKYLKVRITDLMDTPLKDANVVALEYSGEEGSKTESLNEKMVHEKQGVYIKQFKDLPPRGLVKFGLSVATPPKFIHIHETHVTTKVVTSIKVNVIEFSIRDREQTKPNIEEHLSYPSSLSVTPSADHHQIISIKFSVTDAIEPESKFNPHQVFLRFTQKETATEVFIVAEPSSDERYQYILEIDIGTQDKESFKSETGEYRIDLIVGDLRLEDSLTWNLGAVKFSFPAKLEDEEQEIFYEPRPEIKHVFRQPESRPPKVISLIFTCLVLFPWLIILVTWYKIGVNVSNFGKHGLSGFIFQISLLAIICLYAMYFYVLNMFSTLKYLTLLGGVTFFFGHRMLKTRAANRLKQK